MPERVELWWSRRQWSKGVTVPYALGQFRADWERYPVLIRQYHPDLNSGVALTQVPPCADVFLVWQCDVGHVFVATPDEQRNRPTRERRSSVWCPDCAWVAAPKPIIGAAVGGRTPRPKDDAGRPVRSAAPRRQKQHTPAPVPVGEAFTSAHAPPTKSAAEALLRQQLAARLAVDLTPNAVRVSQQFFGRLEVWPDIIIGELQVAIEYDTTGRHGLEHVGAREALDRRKDRILRASGWEVVRVRCGKLQPLGPFDLMESGVTGKVIDRLLDRLREIRGDLIVNSYLADPARANVAFATPPTPRAPARSPSVPRSPR